MARCRYPGVNYFTEKDADVFCGRKNDADTLFTRLMVSPTLVLHGESGIGKSSLILAGLLPCIDDFNNERASEHPGEHFKYLPVPIRLDQLKSMTGDTARSGDACEEFWKEVIAKIKKVVDLDATHIPFTNDIDKNNPWLLAKQ